MRFNLNPPAIIRIRKDNGGYGFARMCYVTLPADTTPHQIKHELVHVRQWWAISLLAASALYIVHLYFALPIEIMALSIGTHSGLYVVSKGYRFWAEAEAYRVSAKTSPQRIEEFAQMLYAYNTGRTLDECRDALLHT